jgi:hypothetical protein
MIWGLAGYRAWALAIKARACGELIQEWEYPTGDTRTQSVQTWEIIAFDCTRLRMSCRRCAASCVCSDVEAVPNA